MKSVIRKLQSQTGASLSFALLLFLVCTVISSIAIVSATAVSGRVSEMTDMDQRYYSVTSAAELLRALVDGKEVTIVEKTVTVNDPTASPTSSENVYQYIFDTDDKQSNSSILDQLIEVDDSTLEVGSSLLNYRFTKDLKRNDPTDDPGNAVKSIVKDAAYAYYSKHYIDSSDSITHGSTGNQRRTLSVTPTESGYTGILNATIYEWLRSDGMLVFEVSSPEDAKHQSYALQLMFSGDFNSRSFSSSSTKLSTKVTGAAEEGEEQEEEVIEITTTTTTKIVTYTWKLAGIRTVDQIGD